MKIRHKVGLREVARNARRLHRDVPRLASQAVLEVALELEGRLKTSAQKRLAKDPTGTLLRSIRTVDQSVEQKTVGTDVEYGRIQDLGGVVRPVRGKYLAIPVEQPKSLRGKWPRDYADGELSPRFPAGKDPVLIHEPTGRLEFSLKPKVKITATRWFSDPVDEMPTWAGEVVVDVIGDAVQLRQQ